MKFGLRYANLGPFTEPGAAIEIAQAAEEAGFESIWTIEHVVVPDSYESVYPYAASGKMTADNSMPIPDPLVWLSFIVGGQSKVAAGRDPNRIEITLSAPDDPAEIAELERRGVHRVLVPVNGMVGLGSQVSDAEGVLRYGRDVVGGR